MKAENDLILLEIGTRLQDIENTVAQLCQSMSLLVPAVQTQQEIELRRLKQQNGKVL